MRLSLGAPDWVPTPGQQPTPFPGQQPSQPSRQPGPAQRPGPVEFGPFEQLLQERLLQRRLVLVSGHLDDATAGAAAAQLMLLDADGDKPITLVLTCPGGDLGAAEMLAETIDLVGVPVHAVCRGTLGGAALAPFAAADRRTASVNALFVLQEPTTAAEGRADEVAALVDQHERQLATVHARLARATGREVHQIAADLRARTLLTAEQALDYGLLDELTRSAR